MQRLKKISGYRTTAANVWSCLIREPSPLEPSATLTGQGSLPRLVALHRVSLRAPLHVRSPGNSPYKRAFQEISLSSASFFLSLYVPLIGITKHRHSRHCGERCGRVMICMLLALLMEKCSSGQPGFWNRPIGA